MGLILPGNFVTLGLFGEEKFARGAKIKAEDIGTMIENCNHLWSEGNRKWWGWVGAGQVVTGGSPPTHDGQQFREETDHTGFVRRFWFKLTLSPGRKRLKIYGDFASGTMRFRYRVSPAGSWSSYVTSSTHGTGTRAIWEPTILVLTAGEAYQFEADMEAYDASNPCDCYGFWCVEEDMQTADL